MTMWGEGGTLKGRYWKLSNGYWAARNHQGKQCTFRLQVEAQRFAEKKLFISRCRKQNYLEITHG